MQEVRNVELSDVQPAPANLPEIRRCALNFRKLMLLFPYVHPAALHGVIVKNNFNWEPILHILFAGEGARAEQFWDEVNEHRELEQALQRHGVRLVCCNGFTENQCPGVQHLQLDEMAEPQNTRHTQVPTCVNIIIEHNPQQPNGEEKDVPKSVLEVETQNNDVIRIILGQRNEGLVVNNAKKTIEIVRNNSVDDNQRTYIIRNLTNPAESTAKEVQTVKKKRTQRTVATKPSEKKLRARKPKRTENKEQTNEQNGTYSVEVENKPITSKKGKASYNTRVKSSKNTTNNHNNQQR